MVKASSCGNSSGHRFGSRFSQKSFFALFSYENEHSGMGKSILLEVSLMKLKISFNGIYLPYMHISGS